MKNTGGPKKKRNMQGREEQRSLNFPIIERGLFFFFLLYADEKGRFAFFITVLRLRIWGKS